MTDTGDAGAGAEYSDVQLLARLLVGLAYIGSDELLSRLRSVGPDVAADVESYANTMPGDETMGEMWSYLALGVLLRDRRVFDFADQRRLHTHLECKIGNVLKQIDAEGFQFFFPGCLYRSSELYKVVALATGRN